MKTIIHNIAEFFENISSKSKGTEIAESSHAEIDRYVSGKVDYYAEEASTVSEAIKEEIGIDIPKDYNYLYFLQGERIRWYRPEQESAEGLLSGGFYMNGVLDIFLYPLDFWKTSVEEFSNIGCEHLVETPENTRWFESTVAHNGSIYKPHYGCVLFEPPSRTSSFFMIAGCLFHYLFRVSRNILRP